MPFSFDSFVNDALKSTDSSLFNNPIYASVLIVFIIMLIIIVMFKDIDESEFSFWTLLFRASTYILISVLSVLCIHYNNLDKEYEKKNSDNIQTNIVKASFEPVSTMFEKPKSLNEILAPSEINNSTI